MKKYLILFFTLLMGTASAQTEQKSAFMGIPLGIDYASFKSQLTDKGFTYDASRSDTGVYAEVYVFHGSFVGETVDLDILTTAKSHTVYAVKVRFAALTLNKKNKASTNALQNDIQKAKTAEIEKNLRAKYGAPSSRKNILDTVGYSNRTVDGTGVDGFPVLIVWRFPSWGIALVVAWGDETGLTRDIHLYYRDNMAEKLKNQEQRPGF